MTKDELIVKQQLEIEGLKVAINLHKKSADGALMGLIHAEQWDVECKDFPRVAMSSIIKARELLEV